MKRKVLRLNRWRQVLPQHQVSFYFPPNWTAETIEANCSDWSSTPLPAIRSDYTEITITEHS